MATMDTQLTESSGAESLGVLSQLDEDIIYFRQAMTKACLTGGSIETIFQEENFAWNNLGWCWDMKVKNAENLRDFFVAFDKSIRVDPDDEANKPISLGVHEIIEKLGRSIGELNPRFKGLLVQMGSSHNGTKINKLDEFDFTYELDIGRLLMEQGRFKRFESRQERIRIFLDVDGQHESFNLFELPEGYSLKTILSMNGSKEYLLYRDLISQEGEEYVLNTEHMAYAFYSLIQRALSQLHLPVGWSHGGVNRPLFSGVRFNLPAFLIQLDYIGTENQTPIHMSVDFAPVLRIPTVSSYSNDVVNGYLIQNGYVRCSWLRLEASLSKIAFYSQAEEIWLAEYAVNSISKSLMRICKGVSQLAKLNSPKLLPRYLAKSVAKTLKDIREGKAENVSATPVFPLTLRLINEYSSPPSVNNDPEVANYDDLGEVGSNEFLSSYMFKRAVMTLMVLDESNGKSWTENDLPDLVVSVFMVINDILMWENQSIEIMTNPREVDSMTRSYDLCPRFAEMSEDGLYDEVEPPTLLEQFCVPLDVYEHQLTPTRDPDANCDSNDNTEATCSRANDLSSSMSDTKDSVSKKAQSNALGWSSTNPPLYFTLLKSVIKHEKCNHLVSLLSRGKYTGNALSIGMDLRISQVFQLLECISEGKKSAEISVWRTPVDPSEDFSHHCLTKGELKKLLD